MTDMGMLIARRMEDENKKMGDISFACPVLCRDSRTVSVDDPDFF
jgi:hypothetical protein